MIKCSLVVATGCLCFLSVGAQASAQQKPTMAELQKEINTINHRTEELQQEVTSLKTQLRAAKYQKSKAQHYYAQRRRSRREQARRHHTTYHRAHKIPHRYEGESHLYNIGSTVTTSPYLGIRTNFAGTDLVVNYSTLNEDLRILHERYKLQNMLHGKLPSARRPRLELSGNVEGQGIYEKPYTGPSTSDIDLTSMEFDILADASPWAFALISMNYDNSLLPVTLDSSGYRIANSRVFIRRAFITIGNLHKAPVYGSIGQMYVPFGRYAYYTLSTPVTEALGRMNERAAVLGFAKDGFYGQAFGFKGDAYVSNDHSINQWGIGGGYKLKRGRNEYGFGAAYIANLADSQGLQETPGGVFKGFGDKHRTEQLRHRVAAVDLHGELDFGPLDFFGEYITALRSFSYSNLMFDGHGAKPAAMNLEAAYNFKISHKPVSVAFSYGRTWQALALGLAQDNFTGVFNISLWKNTIESLEFRHGINYSRGTSFGGNCTASAGGSCQDKSVGGGRNSLIGQVALYF